RRQSQVEAELLRKALSGPGCESFKMIADAGPNASYFGKMPLHFQSPTLERSFAFPKKLVVTVHVLPAAIVFCRVIAQKTQIQKISGQWQEFEGSQVAFVEGAGVGPDPADPIFFEQTDELRAMPRWMAEFDGETKITRQLLQESPQRRFAILW